jgi:hypothetical protein
MSNEPLEIKFEGVISDREVAMSLSGKNAGGGKITFDIGEKEMGAYAALIPLRQVALEITVRVAPGGKTAKKAAQQSIEFTEDDAPAETEKPEWARKAS